VGSRSSLFVPLGAGIKTDVADKLLPVGKDLEVENMQFDLTGTLSKRFGHLAQSVTIQPGATPLPQTWQLTTHKGARVSLAKPGANPLGTYSLAQGSWNEATSDRRGPVKIDITKLTNPGQDPRTAVGGGYIFIASADVALSNTIHLDVIDATTSHLVTGFTFTTANTPFGYDIVFCNGFAVLVTLEVVTGVVFRTLSTASMSVSTTTFAATPGTAALDVIVKNATTISVAYSDGTIHAAAVDFVPSTLATTGWSPRDATASTILMDNFCAWAIDLGGTGKMGLVTASSTQGVRMQWDIPAAGATRQAVTTYNADPATTGALLKIAAHTIDNSATGSFQIIYTTAGATGTTNVTHMAIRTSGVLTTGFVLYRSITVSSKAWTSGGDFYATFAYPSLIAGAPAGNSYVMRLPIVTAQPTLSAPQAQFAIGATLGPAGLSPGNLSSVLSLGSTFVRSLGFIKRVGAQADSGIAPSTFGIELITVTHLSPTSIPMTGPAVEIGDSTLVPGGSIGQFDGAVYGEMGFSYPPDVATFTPGGGGAMTSNVLYWYVFVYARMDAQGRLWRSGVSVPQSVAIGANTSVTIGVPTLRVTGYSTIRIEIYRGAANDENLFQKVGEVANSLSADTVSYGDTASDTALAIGEEVYTGQNDNAILNNDTIPGSSFVFVFQNRVWFISADDPTELWFSNVISPGSGWRFNAQNVVRLADAHGPTYAAGVMDDKIVAIKADAIYSWNGDGPDDAGNGGYAPPLVVALGIGSTNPRSVVSSKDGVFFDSTSNRPGIQMVDHGLNVASAPDGSAFAGAVQRYANEQIMSAILVPEQSQVRFYCLSGRVLVYDMISKNWATFLLNTTGHVVVSAIATSGAALIALNNQTIWLEDTSGVTYTDAGATFSERIASPWIATGGVNGFERLIQMIGAGKTMDDHTLTVQKLHNYDDSTIVETRTFNETVSGTPLWNWEWNRPRVARMSAVKLILIETASSTTNTGAGFNAEGVTMLLGLRDGLNRQPTTTRGP
jgi:hypothetical protein